MIAVCGIGSPSGWRKSAVIANQSAMPPIIAASASAFEDRYAWVGYLRAPLHRVQLGELRRVVVGERLRRRDR
jgi:hypothetical protein